MAPVGRDKETTQGSEALTGEGRGQDPPADPGGEVGVTDQAGVKRSLKTRAGARILHRSH